MKPVTAAAIALITATASPAFADLVTKTSPYSVDHTVNRLALAAEDAGATVFADVDHAAGADTIGTRISPTRMIMFGNPKIGTPAIEAAPTAGLDLPLRVVVYENDDGSVSLSYHDTTDLAATHDIDPNAPYLTTMNGALGKLTDAAIAEEQVNATRDRGRSQTQATSPKTPRFGTLTVQSVPLRVQSVPLGQQSVPL